tara:strand:- start:452 stop:1240 length:789 start_codon:yes stop_codon:yes gene_type:complete
MNKNIVLFDMDGTLTESRQKFDSTILSSSLKELSQYADIGIVTGSDFDYLKEQLNPLLDSSIRYCLHLLPCNGTKYYAPPKLPTQDFELTKEVSMQQQLGKVAWRRLMEILVVNQMKASELDIPLAGHFISARGSMINWSPSGRNANGEERSKFMRYDRKFNFRKRNLSEIRRELTSAELDNIIVKLGGDTSFDIYPTGWDKTFALRYFNGCDVWFVGDRALSPNGNDYEIHKACEPRSFNTTGPKETVDIINEITKQIQGE